MPPFGHQTRVGPIERQPSGRASTADAQGATLGHCHFRSALDTSPVPGDPVGARPAVRNPSARALGQQSADAGARALTAFCPRDPGAVALERRGDGPACAPGGPCPRTSPRCCCSASREVDPAPGRTGSTSRCAELQDMASRISAPAADYPCEPRPVWVPLVGVPEAVGTARRRNQKQRTQFVIRQG